MGRIGGIVLFLLPRARYEYHLLLIDRETDYYMNYIYNIIQKLYKVARSGEQRSYLAMSAILERYKYRINRFFSVMHHYGHRRPCR